MKNYNNNRQGMKYYLKTLTCCYNRYTPYNNYKIQQDNIKDSKLEQILRG